VSLDAEKVKKKNNGGSVTGHKGGCKVTQTCAGKRRDGPEKQAESVETGKTRHGREVDNGDSVGALGGGFATRGEN